MDLALLVLATPICIADLNALVIPNIYSKILLYCALVHVIVYGLGSLHKLGLSALVLGVFLLMGIGMGDIKLMTLILITHTNFGFEFIGYVFLMSVVQILLLTGFHRRIPVKIPLAPSIFLGLATYLATS